MQTENTKTHLLIALPRLFCFKAIFDKTVSSVLDGLGDADVSLVSDNAGKARKLLESKGLTPHEVKISTKLDAKNALKKYSHVLVFWDGEELTDIIYYAKYFNKPIRIVPVQITKVRNKDHDEAFDVYIGRKTPWGNPFPIEHDAHGDKRKEVIEKFKVYFQEEFIDKPDNLKHLLTLRGMRLGCHCKPLPCHGDVIADFINNYFDIAEQLDQIGESQTNKPKVSEHV
ncbi:MAG: protein of unknown function (DUF4326) [Candidatus Nitrotoga sp. CP45]|nr:MAG: protein of unknown function (DUF4326) [Candidatus Nitrotoga sp. CP45]